MKQKTTNQTFILLTLIAAAAILQTSCMNNGGDELDRVLYGVTGGYYTNPITTEEDNSCSSAITVTSTTVVIDEGGDVDRTWVAASPGFTDVDSDGGTAWGLRSTEVCVYLNNAFTGTVEIPITEVANYAGRLTVQTSFPAVADVPASLTFTGDGSTGHGTASRQCFSFTRVDDGNQNVVESDYQLLLGTPTTADDDGLYTTEDPCDISVAMEDDESPGIRVSNISQIMEEPGGNPTSATFKVQLRTTPAASVTMAINDTFDSVNVGHREGIADKSSLTFTDTTEQTVTINSVDDLELDGLKTYIVDVATTSSSDSNYNGLEPRNVTVYNQDQSVPGYNYTLFTTATGSTGTGGGTVSGFATDEANNFGSKYANFTIALRSKPTANVTLAFSNSDTDIANLLTTSLTFTPDNWNVQQTVSVEGKSDGANGGSGNGNIDYTISFVASSSDTTYNNTVTEPSFTVRSCDNDNTRLIQPCNFSGSRYGDSRSRLAQTEPSGSSYIWLIGKSNAGSTVVNLLSDDTTEGTVPASVTVDGTSYDSMESGGNNRIAISHQDDGDVDGTINFGITTSYGSGAVNYDPEDVTASTLDNEKYYYVSRSGSTAEANSSTVATIYVCLGASNTAAVTVNYTCSSDECGASSSGSITWGSTGLQSNATSDATCNGSSTNVRSFTVNGADDSFADGDQNFTVALSGSGGNYDGQSPANQTITNVDNEPAGKAIFVTTSSYNGEMTAAGVKGGDTVCNTNKPGYAPSGTYKAMLAGIGEANTRLATTNGTDATGQTDWVLTAGYYYYRCESGSCSDEVSRLFIADSNALFDPNSMSRDFSSSTNTYWTGLSETNLIMATQSSTPAQAAGDPANRDNCAGFTYTDAPASPNPSYYGETWTDAGSGTVTQNTNVDCATTRKLICVQQ